MRGDPPSYVSCYKALYASTPHARGSTEWSGGEKIRPLVYPACAGIHLSGMYPCSAANGLPRMRGDPPKSMEGESSVKKSTPHARGST